MTDAAEKPEFTDRFWAKVNVRGADDCWPWVGAKIPKGYGALGSVVVDGKRRTQVGAHRISFFLANGYWPRITRHTCDNPPCVNPAHLLDGDEKSNAADMVERGRCPASQRTHCPQGHPYDDENTVRDKRGHRHCRECRNASKRLRPEDRKPPKPHPATLRTHCPQGHEYNPENTYVTRLGHRICRACARDRSAKQRAMNPELYREKARLAYQAKKRAGS